MALAAGAGTTKAALLGKHIVPRRPKICSNQVQATLGREASEAESFRRRDLLSSAAMLGSTLITSETPVQAVQGSVPGRIPGLSETVDEEGFRWYVRPEGKQGNHGIGWSELPQYGFRVPDGWKEIPVSIADPGGAEIDMRMRSDREGDLSVVVAPVKRFIEPPEDRPLTIEEIGSPEKVIEGFGTELFETPVEEESIEDIQKWQDSGLTFYKYKLTPRRLVTATAVKNRVLLLAIGASAVQWRRAGDKLDEIASSLKVFSV